MDYPRQANQSYVFQPRSKSKILKDRSQDSLDDNPTRSKLEGAFIIGTKPVFPYLEPKCWKLYEALRLNKLEFENDLKQRNEFVSTIIKQ